MEPLRAPDAKLVSSNDAERDAIRQQLERMLASPVFKNSRRSPSLLRYVVERTLDGKGTDLKERTLGVEVFGRQPEYDTGADPVVRSTAGEIRKRIALYYHEHSRDGEIRIELSPGSYVPEFSIPASAVAPAPLAPVSAPAVSAPPALPARLWERIWVRAMAGVALLAMAALAALILWGRLAATNLDRFWGPVLTSSNSVLLCVGQREFLGASREAGQSHQESISADVKGPITLYQLYYMGSQNVALSDVKTLGRLTGLLQSEGRSFNIRGQSSTSFADLRDGPVVLVGAFNNDWTLRLMGPLRFSYERNGDVFWIQDRQKPGESSRAVDYRKPYLDVTEDWAVVSRVFDHTTERIVVMAGGLTGYGTTAAGEFLTDPKYLDAVAGSFPAHWERKNIQLLLETKVIQGVSGPPRVIESYFW